MDKELHEKALFVAQRAYANDLQPAKFAMETAIAAYLKMAGLTVVPVDELKRAKTLLHALTIRGIFEAGDEAIEASGINPWCINEGLAEGNERFDPWVLFSHSPFDEVK